MKYYQGAYYFLKLQKVGFGSFKDSEIRTCSTCINDSYFDAWSISWDSGGGENLEEAKEKFRLSESDLKKIHRWADEKFEEKKIGWVNTFSDYSTLKEYKTNFFNNCRDYLILSISFPETEKDALIEEFRIKEKDTGAIGLYDNLKKEVSEVMDDSETVIGFDLIGVELSGDLHSFHCHGLAEELTKKFNINLNKYGLIDNEENWERLAEYMNEEENGFEPVPWFFVKVKQVDENKKASSEIFLGASR